MARPRPTPQPPAVPEDLSEFAKEQNFQLGSGSPRDFARMTAGSKQIGGRSEVKKPEPQ